MRKVLAVLLLSLVTACASLSFDQRLKYVSTSVDSVTRTCGVLRLRERITAPDAKKCLEETDKARAALELTESAAVKGDMSTALGRLRAAELILTEVQRLVEGK